MVDLVGRVLDLVGQHVEEVLALELDRQHPLGVTQPAAHITSARSGAGVAPAVAVHQPVAVDQHRLASGISDADQCLGASRLAVFVVADRRLDPAVGLAGGVDGDALDVTKQGVEGVAGQLAAVLHIKERLVILEVCEPFKPARLLDPAQLLARDLGDNLGGGVRVGSTRSDLGKGQL